MISGSRSGLYVAAFGLSGGAREPKDELVVGDCAFFSMEEGMPREVLTGILFEGDVGFPRAGFGPRGWGYGLENLGLLEL